MAGCFALDHSGRTETKLNTITRNDKTAPEPSRTLSVMVASTLALAMMQVDASIAIITMIESTVLSKVQPKHYQIDPEKAPEPLAQNRRSKDSSQSIRQPSTGKYEQQSN